MITIHPKRRKPARAASWLAGALCALLPLAGHALGLGKLKMHSALNQPLNAEIEFTSLTDAELKGLSVGLASRADFTAAGVERAAFLSQIKFSINRRADGRYVLQLSTPTPIEEPFLHMLLQIDWTGGRLVREYTALIDPPYQVPAKAPAVEPPRAETAAKLEAAPAPTPPAVTTPPAVQPPVETAPVTAPAVVQEQPYGPAKGASVAMSPDGWPLAEGESPTPERATEPKPAAPRSAAKGRISPAPSWANSAGHVVKPGETLWSISKQVRSDSQVSVEQVALAIFRENKRAFIGGNLNNMQSGRILRMPEREAVEALPKEKAHAEFQAQFDAWQEYKLKLASAKRTVAVEEPAEEKEKPATGPAKKAVAEAPAAKKEAPAPAKGERSDEMLKIVRANLQGEKGTGGRMAMEPSKGGEREHVALAERAATLEESLVSKQIEQKELGEKINQVRTQLKREARLLEIESQALAPAPDKAAEKPVEAPKAEAPGAVQGRTDHGAKDAKAEPAKPEAPKAEAPKAPPAEAPKPEAPKAAPKKPVPPPPPAPERGFVESLMDAVGDLLMPLLLGAVVLASAVIGFVYWRRRRHAVAEFEESILASQAVTTTENIPSREAAGEASVAAAESSILSDISQGNLANVHTDEVDPIAEAEVYLAYGRDETAEDILKDAVVKHPQRQELKIKLLEIYSARKDVKAFETLAEEVYAAVGGQGGKLWEKVEEMGRRVSPNNPMFRGTGAAAVVAAAPSVAGATEVAPPPEPTMAPETALDFDLGAPAVTTPAKESSFDLDFDLGGVKPATGVTGEAKKVEAPVTGPAEPKKPTADTGLDFDLGALDLGASAAEPVKESKKATTFDLDFDLGKSDTGPSQAPSVRTAASTSEEFSLDLGAPAGPLAAGEAAMDVAAAAPATTGEAQQQRWDEAATKLDLARAYIDMGDADGARSILEEVMAEGNAEQKKQAQDLISQIR